MVDIVHRKTICLNMIVKNESHIIASTLKNILEHIKIDYWVISDTGSTDDTVDIIQHFFKERGISGEIFHDKWKDFGHNRTKALEHAYDKSDYLFIFDADDLIHGDIQLPSTLDKDTYDLQFGNPVSYHRSILISNRMKWKYVGVLHELLHNVDPIKSRGYLLGNYNIESRRLGDRSKNPNKYVDDALVLEKGFEEENTDLWLKYRYSYYCAQSYQDAGKLEKAIEWYERTLTLDYSPQYKYCACIKAGDCYNVLKQYSNAIDSWSKAYFYDKERLEGIVKIMEYFYNKEQHFMVSSLYNKFKHVKIGNAKDKIFLDYSKYHDFHYFASVSGCYCDEYKSAYEACKYMLLNNRPNSANTIYNLKFYMKHFKEDDDNKSLLDYFVTYIMNPRIVFKERKHAWNIVNSIIKEQLPDKYEILENIITTPQKKNIDKNSKYASSKNILIYTGWMTHLWNESHLDKKALGGSEKAVAYLSRELPKGYNIIISGYVEEGTFANRTYVHQSKLQSILDNTIFHTIIVSRNINFLTEFNNLKCFQLILSLHDTHILAPDNNANHVLDMHNTSIDKVVTLTPWHKSNISKIYQNIPSNKIEIINNGIDISQFPNTKEINDDTIKKIRNKFVWSSRTERGLDIVLNLWSEIIEKIPDATLDICSYGKFPKDQSDQKMLDIINSYESITYLGKLNATELYELMSISEYWLYTNTFPETSCITAMEMLMSGAICLYYPLAGLVDTIGNYGIQVKSGNEIETLMNLSEENKTELIKNGKVYALTCSWTNRAKQWINMLGLDIKNHKIGIFNSFPFHYEMFGFILNYAKNNEILVDIFTNTQNDLGWIDFYREKFNNFNVIDFKKFEGNTNNYSTFFVTTDDDPLFKTEWIDNNVVCLNHYYKIRSPNFKHYLNVANFKDSPLEYSYPCYPLINYKEKKQNTTVCVIGGGNIHTNHNIDIINRLESKNKIILNIFVRKICNTNISGVDTSKFNINFIEDIETQEMIKILKQSSYILINYNSNEDHNNGISCSGSLQLALSTLCKPIMVHTSNKYLQIENALEFDINSNEPINIDGEIDFEVIEQERKKYVDKFEYYLNNIKQSYNFEHDEVNISLLDNIKDYKSIYQNYMDRGNTEIMFRKLITHIFPYFKDKNIIDLGAYIGDNSIPWALKSNGIIYAIDPSKENTDFIDKMTKHNNLDNVVTITKAISNKSETIYYNELNDNHISCNTITGRSLFEATTLDNLKLDNIGFIHLDVEGFEQKVLDGAIKLITTYKPVIAWENHIEKEDYMKIVNFFSSHNYNTFLINEQFPHCFPDCRNFISLPNTSHININNINEKFKETYKEFTPDKNKPFLINMDIPHICVLYNILHSETIKYNTWCDGFAEAIKMLMGNENYKIDFINDSDNKNINFKEYDLILFKESFNGAIYNKYIKYITNTKIGLFISSSNIIPTDVEINKYDILFYETYWYYNYANLKRHPLSFHAFGINTNIMKPYNYEKIYDNIFVGAIIDFKNPLKMINKQGNNLCIGAIIDKNIEVQLNNNNIIVEDYVDYLSLSNKYNQSKNCYLPCSLHGGGERALLEARACNITVEIDETNVKLKELLNSPIYDQNYYYSQINYGLCTFFNKNYSKQIINLIYHKDKGYGNFGDEISKFIIENLINKEKYTLLFNSNNSNYINMIAIGSYIQCAPNNCIIYGSGIRTDPPIEFNSHKYNNLNVKAVRGPLTKQFLEKKNIFVPDIYGDPALLLPLFYQPNFLSEFKNNIGLIPHISNYDLYLNKNLPTNIILICPYDKWENIIDKIFSCKYIISSALHGLICADAYNKPNIWLNEFKLNEGEFKFKDYFLSQNRNWINISNIEELDETKLHTTGNIIDLEKLKNAFIYI